MSRPLANSQYRIMDLLQAKEWNSMNTEDRINYLNSHDVSTRSKVFVDGRAKVGEAVPTRKYQGLVGGLCVGGWHEDEEDAREAAETFKGKAAHA